MKAINTVTGKIPTEKLVVILPHEHINASFLQQLA